MSKQESSNSELTWEEFESQLEKDRKKHEHIDGRKHLLNKMSVQAGGSKIFENEEKSK